jgi:DNA-directed RNA polymerase subunit RPC12/RpoP
MVRLGMKIERCIKCHSKRVVKNGTHPKWSAGKLHHVQYYLCNNCGKQMQGEYVKK